MIFYKRKDDYFLLVKTVTNAMRIITIIIAMAIRINIMLFCGSSYGFTSG